MKLEFKHIAPYLPYGIEFFDYKKAKIVFDTYSVMSTGEYNEYSLPYILKNQVKPILRPLSDLTKEIEVNGERFVPIVELAKIHDSNIQIEKLENQHGTVVAYCKIDYHPSIKKPLARTFFEIDLDDLDFDYGFEVFGEDENDIVQTNFFPVKNQLEIFNQLYEWHFDIHDLIANGLAISCNTLK